MEIIQPQDDCGNTNTAPASKYETQEVRVLPEMIHNASTGHTYLNFDPVVANVSRADALNYLVEDVAGILTSIEHRTADRGTNAMFLQMIQQRLTETKS